MVNFSGVEPTKIFAIRVLRRAVLSQSTKAPGNVFSLGAIVVIYTSILYLYLSIENSATLPLKTQPPL